MTRRSTSLHPEQQCIFAYWWQMAELLLETIFDSYFHRKKDSLCFTRVDTLRAYWKVTIYKQLQAIFWKSWV